jgi:hypothetical protein
MDTGDYDAGIKRSLDQARGFAAETKKVNSELARASQAYAAPQSAAQLHRSEATLQSAIAAKREDMEKQALRERLARMEVEAQAAWQLQEKKTAAALVEYRQRVAIEDRLYAATHTAREVDLRNLQNYYARLRAQHAGNARMLALIDKSYAAESAQVMAQSGGGSLLGMFGGKRLAKQEIKYAAATGLGMHGGEVGMAASAMLAMSGPAALVVGGLILIGSAYSSAEKRAQQLVDAQKSYNAYLREGVEWAKKLAEAPNTAVGRAAGDRAEQLREGARKIEDELQAQKDNARWYQAIPLLLGGIISGDFFTKDMFAGEHKQQQMAAEMKAEADRLELTRHENAGIQSRRDAAAMNAGVESARIAAMAEGPERRRLALVQSQADATRKLTEQLSDRRRFFEQDQSAGSSDRLKEELARQDAIWVNHFAIQAWQRDGARRQAEAEQRQEAASAEEAEIRAYQSGYAREAALLELKHRREIEEYDAAHRDKTNLLRVHAAEDYSQDEGRLKEAMDLVQGLERARDLAQGKATPAQFEWLDLEKKLADLGVIASKVAEIKGLFDQMKQAQADQPLDAEIKNLNIQLDLARGKIDDLEAARRRLGAANPQASPEKIAAVTALQDQVKLANWAKQQADSLKTPVERFREYRDELERAREAGDLTKAQEAALLEKKMGDLMGRPDTGRFSDPASRWQEIQSAVLKPDDTAKLTLEEIRQLRAEIAKLRSDGLPLKG